MAAAKKVAKAAPKSGIQKNWEAVSKVTRAAPRRGGINLLDRSAAFALAPVKEAAVKGLKVPKVLGKAIDELHACRERRRELSSWLLAAVAIEEAYENGILEQFSKSKLEGARGTLMQASVSHISLPTLKDRKKFYAFLKKSGELDLLQARLSQTAVRERWNAGKAVPGVEKFDQVRLSLTSIK